MLNLKSIHHVAIICSDYQASKYFYTEVLGLKIVKETYRANRSSYKLDLLVNDKYQIELFSFPNPPKRITNPEASGLRHLSFEVDDLNILDKVSPLYGSRLKISTCGRVCISNQLLPQSLRTVLLGPNHLPELQVPD